MIQISQRFPNRKLKHAPLLALTLFATFTAIYTSQASAIVVVQNSVVEKLVPEANHANTTRNIVDALASRHYVNTPLEVGAKRS